MTNRYTVTGMTCSACAAHVEKAVRGVAGVSEVQVNVLTGAVTVTGTHFTEGAIAAAVTAAGYGMATPAAKNTAPPAPNAMKRRLWWSVAWLVLLMTVSMGHMVGLPLPAFLSGHAGAANFALTQLLLCLPIVYLNRSYFQKGIPALLRGAPTMDTLVAVGAAASLLYGVFALYRIGYGLGVGDMAVVSRYHSDLYFEGAGMILTLITVGKYLEARSKAGTTEALQKLMQLAPDTATVRRDGTETIIPADQLVVGDRVVLKAGSRIPVDGVVQEGTVTVDEAAVTGESIPVTKAAGAMLVSGTVVVGGYAVFSATRVGQDTTLSQIIRLVEQAGADKAPIARTADAVARVFVPVVMLIALVTGITWLLCGAPFEDALSYAICVLVISCPCALGLATPVAIMVGTGKAAGYGILFKSGEALETAHRVNCVVLDKTGTVTEGKPTVTDSLPLSLSEEDLWQLIADVEAGSEHPLSAALREEAARRGLTPAPVSAFETVAGKGVAATREGGRCLAGNPRFLEENGIATAAVTATLDTLADEGKTPLLFAQNGQLCGIVAVADPLREHAAAAIQDLKRMGVTVHLLTGDTHRTAAAIAAQLGLNDFTAQVLPQDKQAAIARLQQEGNTVAMVGDGINDAPALMRADVGIAIGSGTDIAVDSADVVLMKSDLRDVSTAIRLSRAVLRNIRQNLFWAFFYNCLGIPLAAGALMPLLGWRLTPMFAAAAMSCSSLFVVGNALRLKWFGKIKKEKSTMFTLKIEGMMCAHCQKRVEDALKAAGATVTVDLAAGTATVEGISAEAAIAAVTAAGYSVVS